MAWTRLAWAQMMFKRRDIPPVLLLLLLIILVMLTLSQILVVHNGRYGRNVHNMRKLQLELREMDINLHSLMMQNVPSIELNKRLMQNEINAEKVNSILEQAARTGQKQYHSRLRSRRRHLLLNTSTTASDSPGKSDFFLRMATVQAYSLHQRTVALGYDEYTTVEMSVSSQQDFSNFYCPEVPPHLDGHVNVKVDDSHNVTERGIVAANHALHSGGMFKPADCTARHRVAVIVPFRERKEHLLVLLAHLHPILQRQQLDYTLIVVEQYGSETFNKARLMNIGFIEARKLYSFQCVVFHDVDLVPEDDRNMYSCPSQPRHMSVAIDTLGYRLLYKELVGGVLAMKIEHFERVNGYSNLYWGWGAEDDDMYYRITHVGLKVTRPPETISRYTMAPHKKRSPADWRKRYKLLYTGTRRFQFDGLNSVQYKLVQLTRRPLYTHLMVDIGKPPRRFL